MLQACEIAFLRFGLDMRGSESRHKPRHYADISEAPIPTFLRDVDAILSPLAPVSLLGHATTVTMASADRQLWGHRTVCIAEQGKYELVV